jgi:acyl-CoA thioesterase-2
MTRFYGLGHVSNRIESRLSTVGFVRFFADTETVSALTRTTLGHATTLESVSDSAFRTRAHPGPARRGFGGELGAQAVTAAGLTVPAGLHLHAAHLQFLASSSTTEPIDLAVSRIRDGDRSALRIVHGAQGGDPVLVLTASYHASRPTAGHAPSMPAVPGPDDLRSASELFAGDERNSRWTRALLDEPGVEARFVGEPLRAVTARGGRRSARQQVWLRLKDPLARRPENHDGVVAWVSDLFLLSVALGPHGLDPLDPAIGMVTLNHALWVHGRVDLGGWLLFDQWSRWAGNGRALCQGEIYDAAGALCATVSQEGRARLPSEATPEIHRKIVNSPHCLD